MPWFLVIVGLFALGAGLQTPPPGAPTWQYVTASAVGVAMLATGVALWFWERSRPSDEDD